MTKSIFIPRLPFERLVHQIIENYQRDEKEDFKFRISKKALDIFKKATEEYSMNVIEDSYLIACHSKRITLMSRDIKLARRIRGDIY